jgi:hypothetical protein
MGSGGTGLGPGEAASDQLVHHNFKGTWKKGYVDYDSHSAGSSTATVSASNDGIRGSNSARMVSDTSIVDVSVSATAGGGSGTGSWCLSQSCCAATDTAVLATAVVPTEGRNRTGVTALTLTGSNKPEKNPGNMNAVWVRVLENVPRHVQHSPGVSTAALCHSSGGDDAAAGAGGRAMYKAGRGAVHDNPGGRFKHKTIHFDGPPIVSQDGKEHENEESHQAPLVFVTAHTGEVAADSAGPAAFALSVRSSTSKKFEVNAVRLDHKGTGWQQELNVDYLVLSRPEVAAAGGGAEGLLKTAAGTVAARYGFVPIGPRPEAAATGGGPLTIWVNFLQGGFQPSGTGGGVPTVVLTAQATDMEDQGKDEVFTVVLGPNSTTLTGFAATIARTDESAQSSWTQPVQLNWLALAPA